MIVVGLMSGTSADGTDVAIVEIEGAPPSLRWHLLHHDTVPHPPVLRNAILAATQVQSGTVDKLTLLNVALGEQFAQVALTGIAAAGLAPSQVHLIGSHGQTVWHAPESDPPATLQLGEAAIIAERTALPVVSNFRARDMAAGGAGAPLVAYVDVLLLTHATEIRAAQNIGGIGNVTFLPPTNRSGSPSHSGTTSRSGSTGRSGTTGRSNLAAIAFDTGPGNVLLDEVAAHITNQQWRYDRDGALAAAGRIDEPLLTWLLAHPYFARRPPKTTGRELFGRDFARQVWQRGQDNGLDAASIMATLTALTARSISHAYHTFLPQFPDVVVASGGGTRNPTLMRLLADDLRPARLLFSSDLGIPNEAKEALAFAILAYETWHGRPGNLPAATGARHAVRLGQITPAAGKHRHNLRYT